MASLWRETAGGGIPRPALTGNQKTDVLVVGGGMAGILIAHRLREAGVKCLVAEGNTVGSGVTQNTTAKITAQHGLVYGSLIRRFGLEKARRYYEANMDAVAAFRALAARFPCDFEEKTAYVYSLKRRKLEEEAQAYHRMGLPARVTERPPLPLQTAGALAMEGQAQFHPLKLLYALAEGLEIHEHTFVRNIAGHTAYTDGGSITARHIILATHYPLVNIPGLYFMKLYQSRSYVLALEGAPLPDGMFLDQREDGCSFRTHGNLLLMGGGDHKTGKPGGGYARLRTLAARWYPGAAERFHWATQDCMTLDHVPYLGRHRTGNETLYVATGFQKWGMTGSMVGAGLIRDLIVYGKSPLEELYRPSRSLFTAQLFGNLGSAAAGLLSPGGPRCTHMGCKLHRNAGEGTWDCACHGSRFAPDGHVRNNPAKRGLRP